MQPDITKSCGILTFDKVWAIIHAYVRHYGFFPLFVRFRKWSETSPLTPAPVMPTLRCTMKICVLWTTFWTTFWTHAPFSRCSPPKWDAGRYTLSFCACKVLILECHAKVHLHTWVGSAACRLQEGSFISKHDAIEASMSIAVTFCWEKKKNLSWYTLVYGLPFWEDSVRLSTLDWRNSFKQLVIKINSLAIHSISG